MIFLDNPQQPTQKGLNIMSLALPISGTSSQPSGSAQYAVSGSDLPADPFKPGAPAGGVSSSDILRGQKAVAINHNGSTYRLQATRLGKLILTK